MDSRLSDGTLSGYAQKRIDDYPFAVLIPRHYFADSFTNHSAGVTGTSLVVDNGYITTAEWDCAQV